jgi:hypothetical protein
VAFEGLLVAALDLVGQQQHKERRVPGLTTTGSLLAHSRLTPNVALRLVADSRQRAGYVG